MAIHSYKGILPTLDPKSHIFDGAQVIGDVRMAEYSSIWFNCVARGDVNTILIGKYSNVQDGTIIHNSDIYPADIGDYVTIGHGAIIHGCKIEDHCLIGMGSTILSGAVIGRGSIIAAGALVKEKAVIPPYSLVVGVPGKIIRTHDEKVIEKIHHQAIKYKTLWTKYYGLLPDADGEVYHGEQIV